MRQNFSLCIHCRFSEILWDIVILFILTSPAMMIAFFPNNGLAIENSFVFKVSVTENIGEPEITNNLKETVKRILESSEMIVMARGASKYNGVINLRLGGHSLGKTYIEEGGNLGNISPKHSCLAFRVVGDLELEIKQFDASRSVSIERVAHPSTINECSQEDSLAPIEKSILEVEKEVFLEIGRFFNTTFGEKSEYLHFVVLYWVNLSGQYPKDGTFPRKVFIEYCKLGDPAPELVNSISLNHPNPQMREKAEKFLTQTGFSRYYSNPC